MERLVLSVWIALAVVTMAGTVVADDRAMVSRRFPKLPVPAGDSISATKAELGRRVFYEEQVFPWSPLDCPHCESGCAA